MYLYTTYTDVTVDGGSALNCGGHYTCRIGYGLQTQEARVAFNYHFR